MVDTGARRIQSTDDLFSLPDNVRADFIGGQVEVRAEPSCIHEDPVDGILTELRSRFRGPKGPGGSGGWWILTSTLIRFPSGEALCPDLAGWRRDRVPEKLRQHPVTVRPDWVCEVSVSSRRKDSTTVPKLLAENDVPWYWRVDVETSNLLVYELSERGYVQKMSLFREDGVLRIPPFESVELSVPLLFGDDGNE